MGRGSFGTVYKCLNKIDGGIYAVKCTKNKITGKIRKLITLKKIGSESKKALLNEAQALALFSKEENPTIVRYYNTWIEDDRLYIVVKKAFIKSLNKSK